MPEKALSVTALTKYIKLKFDSDVHLKDILLEGEISNFKQNIRGHLYFTLKDERSQISAVMFKGNAWKVKFKPKEGMHVLVRGYVSVFEVAGSYQVYVESMEEVGLGNLYQAYLQLKERLEKEGLFDKRHKKTLPRFPSQIAVLTSSTGAAVRDVIHILNRRYPLVKVVVYPTVVQGENAKASIVDNLEDANANPENDLIILGRGGGSIEDLWAFNEEVVARAIFASKLPIISAVGHETDFTIADFVADVRAPTPSGAAEISVPDQRTLMRDLARSKQRLEDALKRRLTQKKEQLDRQREKYVFKDPLRILMPYGQRLEHLHEKMRLMHPRKRVAEEHRQLLEKEKALHRAYHLVLKDARATLQKSGEHLEYVNPLAIMKKGYTLIRQNGKFVKTVDDVKRDEQLEIGFHDGRVFAAVKTIEKDDQDG